MYEDVKTCRLLLIPLCCSSSIIYILHPQGISNCKLIFREKNPLNPHNDLYDFSSGDTLRNYTIFSHICYTGCPWSLLPIWKYSKVYKMCFKSGKRELEIWKRLHRYPVCQEGIKKGLKWTEASPNHSKTIGNIFQLTWYTVPWLSNMNKTFEFSSMIIQRLCSTAWFSRRWRTNH